MHLLVQFIHSYQGSSQISCNNTKSNRTVHVIFHYSFAFSDSFPSGNAFDYQVSPNNTCKYSTTPWSSSPTCKTDKSRKT